MVGRLPAAVPQMHVDELLAHVVGEPVPVQIGIGPYVGGAPVTPSQLPLVALSPADGCGVGQSGAGGIGIERQRDSGPVGSEIDEWECVPGLAGFVAEVIGIASAAGVSKDATMIAAPALDLPGHHDDACLLGARLDVLRDHACAKVDRRRGCPCAGMTEPELSVVVVAPALEGAIEQYRACMILPGGHVDRRLAEGQCREAVAHLTGAVAPGGVGSQPKISVAVVAPALDIATIDYRAVEVVPGR